MDFELLIDICEDGDLALQVHKGIQDTLIIGQSDLDNMSEETDIVILNISEQMLLHESLTKLIDQYKKDGKI